MAPASSSSPPERRRTDRGTTSLQVDLASLAYIVGALLTALAVIALSRAASSAITKVAVGLLLAAALDPLVVRARRTFHWSRTGAAALVATALGGAAGALAPRSVRARRPFHGGRTWAFALVATVLVGAFAAIALLLAPPAIRQGQALT